VGDIDGDGRIEIVVATNEEYAGHADLFDSDSYVFQALKLAVSVGGFDDLRLDVAGRVYALNHDGSPVERVGTALASWPAPVPLLVSGLLPDVGTGTPGSPALADVDGDGDLEIAIFGTVGPVMVLDATGASALPSFQDAPGALVHVFERDRETIGRERLADAIDFLAPELGRLAGDFENGAEFDRQLVRSIADGIIGFGHLGEDRLEIDAKPLGGIPRRRELRGLR